MVCENGDANTLKPGRISIQDLLNYFVVENADLSGLFCIQEVYFTRIEKSGKWVENEGHGIKGSGLEGKNIVTSGQILSVVIAM